MEGELGHACTSYGNDLGDGEPLPLKLEFYIMRKESSTRQSKIPSKDPVKVCTFLVQHNAITRAGQNGNVYINLR